MARLLLVRHAQSENNASDEAIYRRYPNDLLRAYVEANHARRSDPQLSEVGRSQAKQLAQSLVPLLADAPEQVLLVSSPMRRALQTAMPLAIGAGLSRERFICHAELFEIGSRYYKQPPSRRVAQLEAEYPLNCQAIPSDELYATGKRESEAQARARIDRVIAWFEALLTGEQERLVVAVAHGHLLTRWLRRWIGVPWGRGLGFVHANAGVTMLSWDPRDGLLLEFANDQSHLDPELQTGGGSSGWWSYTLPDIEVEHYDGWSMIPKALAAELAALREQLLERDGKTLRDYAELDVHNVHIVVRVEGKLAGYVQYDLDLGRLRQLIVAPSHRRASLGRRLLAEAEDEAMLDGRTELLVHAWLDAVEFYRALGFMPRGEVVHGPGMPWQAMVKPLLVK